MTDRTLTLVAACAALTVVVGCSKSPDATTAIEASQPAATAQGAAPDASAAGAPAPVVSGTVIETMDAANYTYIRLDTGKEQVWVAASPFPTKVGETLNVMLDMPMQNFHSKALNRDFPIIYFVSTPGRDGNPPGGTRPSAAPAMMTSRGSSPGASAQPAPVGKIDPPAGGMSIADVWARRDALAGKTVVVRGQVVKYNAQIMGHNWLHIQDGSGASADGTNDLTVTTDDAVKVGDIVTVTGTLATKKDFGAGYAYEAMVEKATVKLQ